MTLLHEQGWTCDIVKEGIDDLSDYKNRSMMEQSFTNKLLLNNF